jgi:ATP-binding cassette subfamily B protein AbcA/BmrA
LKDEKSSNLKLLWDITNPPKSPFFLGTACALINTVCALIIPLVIKEQIEHLNGIIGLKELITLGSLFLLEIVSMFFALYLLSLVGQRLVANLRIKLWKKLLHLKLDFHNTNNSGELISRVTNDTTVTMNLLSADIAELLTGFLSIIGSIIILFILDVPMTLILISSIPITMLIVMPIAKKMEDISYKQQERISDLTGFLSQILSEIRLVKSYGSETYEYERGSERIEELYNNGMKKAKMEAILSPLLSAVLTIVIITIIGIGAYRVGKGFISSGELIAFILYLFQIVGPVGTVSHFVTNLKSATGATERIYNILQEEEENLRSDRDKKIHIKGNISIENLCFSYKEKQVLNNISFSAHPDTLTAIVGPSGVGKSTLFYLLERFYEPQSGGIYIDGISQKDISVGEWRSWISYVSQDCSILASTIKENLTYGIAREVSEEEIRHAADLANCTEFIEEMSEGFNTMIGERGINLSGGQKQRIAIARAFLKDAPILLLDEATANLDINSEKMIKESLKTLMKGRTTLIITHRLSTIKDANQIIVLDKEGVSGIGIHEELIKGNKLYINLSVGKVAL